MSTFVGRSVGLSVGRSVCLWKKSQNRGLVIRYQGARLLYNVHR